MTESEESMPAHDEPTEPKGSRRRGRLLAFADSTEEPGAPPHDIERPFMKKVRRRVVSKSVAPPRPSDRAASEGSEASTRKTADRVSPFRGEGSSRRVDKEAREELADLQEGRRQFLKKATIGAGLVALGASLGFGSGYASATGFGGRTVITDTEIAARVIAGVRIATEFIPDPVPAGTDADPYPGSAIQAALNDGFAVYVPSGTWNLSSTISRAADNVTIVGAGKSTKLVLDGVNPCISAGAQSGWLIANLATDAGGVDIASASQTRLTEVWVNGVLSDNRPIAAGGGGGGGYYGVRAEDYITSGDGSPSNPYNASAIQAAINALPSRGGTVFIKEGVWRGTIRIAGPTSGNKKVILQGAGAEYSQYVEDQVGTTIQAGFDFYQPTDLYDLTISPHPNNFDVQPCVKYILDPTKISTFNRWTGGFTIKRVRFSEGDPGLWFTGQNLASNVWQVWGARVEQCGFFGGKRGLKVDHGDSTNVDKGRLWNVMFEQLIFQHNAATGAGRTIDISGIDHWKGSMGNVLVEDCSSSSSDYAIYIDVFGSGGLLLYNFDMGDGSNAPKDYYLNLGRETTFVNLRHEKDVDIASRGRFIGIGRGSTSPGSVNLLSGAQDVYVEANSGVIFSLGSLGGNMNTTKTVRTPGGGNQLIGTTTPGSSPYTYTNQDGRDEMVYLVSGTITDIAREGQSIGSDRSHLLAPGASITISYTSAPTIRRYGVS